MKTLKKIRLNGNYEFLSEVEMKKVIGGYGPCFLFDFFCKEDEECDWFAGYCVKKKTGPSVKETCCEGKSQGDSCTCDCPDSEKKYSGTCLMFAGGSLHCSDMGNPANC